MKPHVKVIQRNGVDIFVASSMTSESVSDFELRKIREGFTKNVRVLGDAMLLAVSKIYPADR
jgi:hypothetical protein